MTKELENQLKEYYRVLLEDLDSSEIESILKSNVINHKLRKHIRFLKGIKTVMECLPSIAAIMAGALVVREIHKRLEE